MNKTIEFDRVATPLDDNQKDDLSCIICRNLLIKPIECSECHSNFCTECINRWIEEKDECPNKCENFQLRTTHKIVRKMLMDIEVRCENYKDGCMEVLKYSAIRNHEENCQYKWDQCPNNGCNFRGQKKDMESHLKDCEFQNYECPECGSIYKKKIEKHSCILAFKKIVENSVIMANEAKRESEERIREMEFKFAEMKKDLEEKVSALESKVYQNELDSYTSEEIFCNLCHKSNFSGIRYHHGENINYCENCFQKEVSLSSTYMKLFRPIAIVIYSIKSTIDLDSIFACRYCVEVEAFHPNSSLTIQIRHLNKQLKSFEFSPYYCIVNRKLIRFSFEIEYTMKNKIQRVEFRFYCPERKQCFGKPFYVEL